MSKSLAQSPPPTACGWELILRGEQGREESPLVSEERLGIERDDIEDGILRLMSRLLLSFVIPQGRGGQVEGAAGGELRADRRAGCVG
jgi:hypothetical protein